MNINETTLKDASFDNTKYLVSYLKGGQTYKGYLTAVYRNADNTNVCVNVHNDVIGISLSNITEVKPTTYTWS